MNNKFVYTVIFFCMLAFSIVFGYIYQNDLNRPKVRHSGVPEFVHHAIKNFNEQSPDFYVGDISFGPGKWSNKRDPGVKDAWTRMEGNGFVIYYRKDKEAKEYQRARDVLNEFNRERDQRRSVPRGEGPQYVEPQSVNNRMLAFYLPPTEEEYNAIVLRLAGGNADSIFKYKDMDIAGYTLSEFGPLGFKASGIVIKPSAFEVDMDQPGSYREGVRHSMADYQEWALAELALLELDDVAPGTVPPEYFEKMNLAGHVGKLMLEAMAQDSVYADAVAAIGEMSDTAASDSDADLSALESEAFEEQPEETPAPKAKKKAKSPYLPE